MKRTALHRDPTYRMPRDPAKQLQRGAKRMKAVSPKRAQKRKVARERFMDGFGVYFDEVPLLLGPVANWPKVRIVDNVGSRDLMQSEYRCFYCERWEVRGVEVHHLFGGSRGRCDSLTNLMPVCRKCHEEIQSVPALLPKVLYQKWKHDRSHVSWVRLTLLHGRFFDFATLA